MSSLAYSTDAALYSSLLILHPPHVLPSLSKECFPETHTLISELKNVMFPAVRNDKPRLVEMRPFSSRIRRNVLTPYREMSIDAWAC